MENKDRAELARNPFEFFRLMADPDCGEPAQTMLVDFLTDLRHMADEDKLDFNAAIESSAMHYKAEKAGEL